MSFDPNPIDRMPAADRRIETTYYVHTYYTHAAPPPINVRKDIYTRRKVHIAPYMLLV